MATLLGRVQGVVVHISIYGVTFVLKDSKFRAFRVLVCRGNATNIESDLLSLYSTSASAKALFDRPSPQNIGLLLCVNNPAFATFTRAR